MRVNMLFVYMTHTPKLFDMIKKESKILNCTNEFVSLQRLIT